MMNYVNEIYPIDLVLAMYEDEEIFSEFECPYGDMILNEHEEATTYRLTRKGEIPKPYHQMVVAIIFNTKEITPRLATHEALHATSYMLNQLGIELTNSSEEAWAYLIGWIASCIDGFKKQFEFENKYELVKKEECEKLSDNG